MKLPDSLAVQRLALGVSNDCASHRVRAASFHPRLCGERFVAASERFRQPMHRRAATDWHPQGREHTQKKRQKTANRRRCDTDGGRSMFPEFRALPTIRRSISGVS